MAEKPEASLPSEEHGHLFLPGAFVLATCFRREVVTCLGHMLREKGDANEQQLSKRRGATEQEEGWQAPNPGLLDAHPACNGHIRPPGTKPSQHKKQINKNIY